MSMLDKLLLAACIAIILFVVGWQLLAWLFNPPSASRDVFGDGLTLRVRPLTYREREYLAACNKDGFRYAIVPDEDA